MPKPTITPPPYMAESGNIPTAEPGKLIQLPGTSPAPPPKKRPALDLERLEIDYRAAKLTVREMGALHGVTGGRVVQLAKKLGWTQDISAKARREANALIVDPKRQERREALNATINSVISDAASEMVGIRLAHRELINAQRRIVRNLIGKLGNLGEPDLGERLEQALDAIAAGQREGAGTMSPTEYAALVSAVNRATGVAGQAKVIKDLAMASEKLVALERQAYDLDDPEKAKPPATEPDRSKSPAEHYRWLCEIRGAA